MILPSSQMLRELRTGSSSLGDSGSTPEIFPHKAGIRVFSLLTLLTSDLQSVDIPFFEPSNLNAGDNCYPLSQEISLYLRSFLSFQKDPIVGDPFSILNY